MNSPRLHPVQAVQTKSFRKSPDAIQTTRLSLSGRRPVFGRMNGIVLEDFVDLKRYGSGANPTRANCQRPFVIVGVGATILAEKWDVLVYADMARWEIQQRQRGGQIGQLGREQSI